MASSRCGNAGEGSIQNNNCIGVSSNGCNNIGDGSTQNNNCVRMSAECDNFGKGSIQDSNCIDFPLGQTGCRNTVTMVPKITFVKILMTHVIIVVLVVARRTSVPISGVRTRDVGLMAISLPKQTSVRTLQVILKEDAKSMVVMSPEKIQVIPVLAIVLIKTFVL